MSKFDFLLDQTWVENNELLDQFELPCNTALHRSCTCAGISSSGEIVAIAYGGSDTWDAPSNEVALTASAITFLPEMYRTLHEISEYANLLRLGGPAPHDLKDLYSGLMESTKLAHALLNKMENS